MKPGPAPRRSTNTITTEFDGETIVYHRAIGDVHRLNSVGAVVWRSLDGQATVDELVGDLSAAFGVEPRAVRRDVNDLLERLSKESLLADGPYPVELSEPRLLTNPPSP